MRYYFFVISFISCLFHGKSQCEVKNKLWPDQTMYYYMEPSLFYYTHQKSLKGNITTDKNNYFLRLFPKPFPAESDKKKLDGDLAVKLDYDTTVIFKYFDYQYREKDTSLAMMYLIPDDVITILAEHEIKSILIELGDEQGSRSYDFVLHKAALKEQLNCLKNLK